MSGSASFRSLVVVVSAIASTSTQRRGCSGLFSSAQRDRTRPTAWTTMAPTHGRSARDSQKMWTFTNNMNMRDLSRDDDFLSYMLIETLGTGNAPLVVHKMDPTKRLPQFQPEEVIAIVKRWLLYTKTTSAKRIRGAVDALLQMHAVRHYLRHTSRSQINAFATHAARYFEIYLPQSTTEIAHTSRYSHRTGKAELCILATQHLPVGTVITELKGSMAVLTEEENEELKRTTGRNAPGTRRDFSVIHSGHRKKNHLFLGPARFVNHDCDNNCDLVREGKYITFRVIKPIAPGQEVTAHYGDSYFGKGNRHCLCESCEKLGQGGYRQDPYTDSDHSSDSDVSTSTDRGREVGAVQQVQVLGAVNERRTRRGVYTTLPSSESESETSDASDEDPEDRISQRRDNVLMEQLDVTEVGQESVMQIVATNPSPPSTFTPISQSPSSSTLDRLHSPEDGSHIFHTETNGATPSLSPRFEVSAEFEDPGSGRSHSTALSITSVLSSTSRNFCSTSNRSSSSCSLVASNSPRVSVEHDVPSLLESSTRTSSRHTSLSSSQSRPASIPSPSLSRTSGSLQSAPRSSLSSTTGPPHTLRRLPASTAVTSQISNDATLSRSHGLHNENPILPSSSPIPVRYSSRINLRGKATQTPVLQLNTPTYTRSENSASPYPVLGDNGVHHIKAEDPEITPRRSSRARLSNKLTPTIIGEGGVEEQRASGKWSEDARNTVKAGPSKLLNPSVTGSSQLPTMRPGIGLNSTVVIPRKRGRPPKQPKCCGICSRVLTQVDLIGKDKNWEPECTRCSRHFAIFGAPWPSRVPLFIPSLPSPTPESSPEPEVLTKKRAHDRASNGERTSKRRRIEEHNYDRTSSKRNETEHKANPVLSKRELKRQRKNERRREARAQARAMKLEQRRSLKEPDRYLDSDCNSDNSGNNSEEELKTRSVLLTAIVKSYNDILAGGYNTFRRGQRGRWSAANLAGMKRTPEALAAKMWQRLPDQHEAEAMASDTSSDENLVGQPPSTAESLLNLEIFSDVTSTGKSLDVRPSSFASRKLRSRSTSYLYPPRPPLSCAASSEEEFDSPTQMRKEIRITYLTPTPQTPKSSRNLQQNGGVNSATSNRSKKAEQPPFYVDTTLLRKPVKGEFTDMEETFYEANEDRLPVSDPPYHTPFFDKPCQIEPRKVNWAFHEPFHLRARELSADGFPSRVSEDGVKYCPACNERSKATSPSHTSFELRGESDEESDTSSYRRSADLSWEISTVIRTEAERREGTKGNAHQEIELSDCKYLQRPDLTPSLEPPVFRMSFADVDIVPSLNEEVLLRHAQWETVQPDLSDVDSDFCMGG